MIPHALWQKNQNTEQKQHFTKFNNDFNNGPHQKIFGRKKRMWPSPDDYRHPLNSTFKWEIEPKNQGSKEKYRQLYFDRSLFCWGYWHMKVTINHHPTKVLKNYMLKKFYIYIYTHTHRRRQWPHSSTLAWKIPWTEEPGRLQSMGSQRVGHDWATSLSLFTFLHWRRKWHPTPVFLPGESQGRGSLVGCRLWGCVSQTRLSDFTSLSYTHTHTHRHICVCVCECMCVYNWITLLYIWK